jgi:hypothetical protein
MQCPNCRGEQFQHPAEPSAVEIRVCLSCGHEVAVHCNYLIPGSYPDHHARFLGTYRVSSPVSAIKDHLKLQRILKDGERFSPSKLERQFLDKKAAWDLGEFLDFEKERIEAECKKQGVNVTFSKVEEH